METRNIRTTICLLTVVSVLTTLSTFGAATVERDDGKYVLENSFVSLRVNPAKGGMVDQYVVKATGRQLVADGTFMLGDHFWQQLWPGEFLSAPYEAKILTQTAEEVTLEVSCVSKQWQDDTAQKDIKIIRRMTLRAGSPVLSVEVTMENVGDVGRLAGYWNQSILYAGGRKDEKQLYFRPSSRGVSTASYDSVSGLRTADVGTVDGFVRDVQNGWMAVTGAECKSGLAFVMKYDELMFLYSCLGQFTTEWQYRAVGIPRGKAWSTDFVVYPIARLPRVDYASRRIVAGVEPDDADGILTVQLHLAAADVELTGATVNGEVALVKKAKRPTTPFEPQTVDKITSTPTTLTFKLPHDPSQPLALRFVVNAKAGDVLVEERFETWYGADYGSNRRVDNSPLYVLPSPPRKVTFLRPDVIEKIVNDKPHVLLCKGMYADEYLPATIFETINAGVENSYFQTPGVWPARLSYFPASYEELMGLDVIALINVDAVAVGEVGEEMLHDFVTHGGTLIYGGEMWAYAHGNLGDGKLADLLPVTFPEARGRDSLQYLKSRPVEKQVAPGRKSPLGNAVMVYAGDDFTVKDGADVLLSSGEAPVLVSWRIGKGRVIAITGTALGKAPPESMLFTDTPEWAALVAGILE